MPVRVDNSACRGHNFSVTYPLWGDFTGHRCTKGQYCGTLLFSLMYAWTNDWNKESTRRWYETPGSACDVTELICGIDFIIVHYSDVKNERDDVSNHQRLDCLLNRWVVIQRKQQSSASLAFARGIHRSPVDSPHKGPVTQKMFPFDDVIMHHCANRCPNTKRCFVVSKNDANDN